MVRDSNGECRSGWINISGTIDTRRTATVLDVVVVSRSHAAPGPVLARTRVSSASKGAMMSLMSSHSTRILTVVGNCPI